MQRGAIRGIFCGLVALLATAASSQSEYVVQWTADGLGTDGYRLELGTASGVRDQSIDFGLVPEDVDGVRRMPIMLDRSVDHYLAIVAYGSGGDSPPSNEIGVAALACDPTVCDDGNPCTADGCAGSSCSSSVLPDRTICAMDGSICLSGVCTAVECFADGDCSDGDACNGQEICSSSGTCGAGAPLTCGSASVCMIALCDPLSGCAVAPAADGLPCDDGSAATVGDACLAGVCVGAADPALAIASVEPDVLRRGRHIVEIRGSGFSMGSTVTFAAGDGPAPSVRSLTLESAGLLRAELEVRRGGPKRVRSWDVVVATPDGSRAVLPGGLRIMP